MYDLVYEAMQNAGVASSKRVSGEPIQYHLDHPEYVLFVDEVGNNTNMREDGHFGGSKYLGVVKGEEVKINASSTEARWTLLGFTNACGEPILCAIIFAVENFTALERLGLDITAERIGDNPWLARLDDVNYGPGKVYPGPPTCSFNGKEVPAYVTCSSKGSITSKILAQTLKWIDERDVLPRKPNGPTPFLLLDGHESRIDLPFLDYINNDDHKWVVCLGLPNGTSLWQVGDSSQQNGCYKMYCTKRKMELIKYKQDHNLFNTNLERTDIVPIINYAWEKSFAKIDSNKRAIAERGWNPLNRNLLKHPAILNTKTMNPPTQQTETSSISDLTDDGIDCQLETKSSIPVNINFARGKSNEVLTDILQSFIRSEEAVKNFQQRKDNGGALVEKIDTSKKLTAGVLFNAKHVVMDAEVREIIGDKCERRDTAAMKKSLRAYGEFKSREATVKSLIDKGSTAEETPEKLTGEQLKTLLQWKKRKGDEPVPRSIKEKRERWMSIKNREDQTITEFLKDRKVFENYSAQTKGKGLTIDVLNNLHNLRTTVATSTTQETPLEEV